MERLREHAYQHLKELKCKAHLVYSQLDEWIGMKFHGEMDAIRELVNIIKDAVELEQRLPNELVLENDAIFVNTEILTYEPEPQPRPQSAVEAKSSDKFTVFQLLNLTMQLRELAPQGVISTKEFKDLIRRMALANCELLPESIQSYDVGQVHTVWLAACAQVRMVLYEPLHHLPTQLVQTLDPIQAGLIFWHDALVRLAQLQPIDLASLLRVKEAFQEADKTDSGKVDWASFSTIKLWFEENDDGRSGSASSSSTFDRSQKLKEALFYMFADAQPATGSTTNSALRWLKEHERVPTENLCFNYRHFLLNASLDSDASLGAEKAFSAVSHREDNSVTRQELEQIYHLDVAGAATAVLPLSAVDDLFVQLGEGEQTVTFSQWKRFLEGRQTAFLDCPYFQLKE